MMRDFSPEEISYLSASFAVSLAENLDNESIRVLCSFFVNVVSTLNLISAQRGLCEKCGEHGHKPEKPHEDHRPER